MSDSQLIGIIKEYREFVVKLMTEMFDEMESVKGYGILRTSSKPYKEMYKCLKDRLVKVDNALEEIT